MMQESLLESAKKPVHEMLHTLIHPLNMQAI